MIPPGNELLRLLQRTGVDVTYVQRTDVYPTRQVIVTRSMEGNRELGAFMNYRPPHEFADCELDLHELTTPTRFFVDAIPTKMDRLQYAQPGISKVT